MKGSRVFAIRMGDWVEFRAADEPPKRVSSSFKRKGVRQERDYTAPFDRVKMEFPWKDVPFTVKIQVVAYEGGRPLVARKLRDCKRFLPRLPKNGMVELDPMMAGVFLSARRRKSGQKQA